MTNLSEITLESLLQGAAAERFAHELDRVLENIQDINTQPDKPRSITLTVTFHPDENRTRGEIALETKAKLTPLKSVTGPVWFGEKDGRLVAAGFDPGQRNLFPDSQDPQITPIPQRSADG